MAEYIKREAAINGIIKIIRKSDMPTEDWSKGMLAAMSTLYRIPAADVRPVVLCRDCKYYYKDADGYEMCDNSEGYDHVTEDGFCAWAVKREES